MTLMQSPLGKMIRASIREHNKSGRPVVSLLRILFIGGIQARVIVRARNCDQYIDIPRDLPKTARNRMHKALKRLA